MGFALHFGGSRAYDRRHTQTWVLGSGDGKMSDLMQAILSLEGGALLGAGLFLLVRLEDAFTDSVLK